MKTQVTDLFLYRWRYLLGYIVVTLLIVVVVGMVATLIPGALRAGETQSALTSGELSIKFLAPDMVVDWPYHILQRGSFLVFGVTTFSIKLPSMIIGFFTALGIFMLIRQWFRRNIAIIVSIIAVTMTPFLFMIQDGTPTIMFTALTVWLLVAGTHVTRGHLFGTFWKVLGCVLLAISLYTPLGVYLTVALIITASFHPHIRYVIRRIAKLRLILAVVLGSLSIAPLAYAIYLDPTVASRVLGFPTNSIDIGANIVTVGQNLFGFFSTSDSHILRPMFSIATTLLVLIGIYKLLTIKYTARSYVIIILAIILSVIIIISPQYAYDLYPIIVLMVAMGITSIIVDWYKLFPRNPYARIAGLIPLAILVIGMAFSDITRYTNNYLYNPNIVAHYSFDLKILHQTLNKRSNGTAFALVTTDTERKFYELVAHYDKRLVVTTQFQADQPQALVTRDAHERSTPTNWTLTEIITSRRATSADRFYLYKTDVK